jgi:hypothetical protein
VAFGVVLFLDGASSLPSMLLSLNPEFAAPLPRQGSVPH